MVKERSILAVHLTKKSYVFFLEKLAITLSRKVFIAPNSLT